MPFFDACEDYYKKKSRSASFTISGIYLLSQNSKGAFIYRYKRFMVYMLLPFMTMKFHDLFLNRYDLVVYSLNRKWRNEPAASWSRGSVTPSLIQFEFLDFWESTYTSAT
jgi:hypothetical protein